MKQMSKTMWVFYWVCLAASMLLLPASIFLLSSGQFSGYQMPLIAFTPASPWLLFIFAWLVQQTTAVSPKTNK